jgi:hypothetical protein
LGGTLLGGFLSTDLVLSSRWRFHSLTLLTGTKRGSSQYVTSASICDSVYLDVAAFGFGEFRSTVPAMKSRITQEVGPSWDR